MVCRSDARNEWFLHTINTSYKAQAGGGQPLLLVLSLWLKAEQLHLQHADILFGYELKFRKNSFSIFCLTISQNSNKILGYNSIRAVKERVELFHREGGFKRTIPQEIRRLVQGEAERA